MNTALLERPQARYIPVNEMQPAKPDLIPVFREDLRSGRLKTAVEGIYVAFDKGVHPLQTANPVALEHLMDRETDPSDRSKDQGPYSFLATVFCPESYEAGFAQEFMGENMNRAAYIARLTGRRLHVNYDTDGLYDERFRSHLKNFGMHSFTAAELLENKPPKITTRNRDAIQDTLRTMQYMGAPLFIDDVDMGTDEKNFSREILEVFSEFVKIDGIKFAPSMFYKITKDPVAIDRRTRTLLNYGLQYTDNFVIEGVDRENIRQLHGIFDEYAREVPQLKVKIQSRTVKEGYSTEEAPGVRIGMDEAINQYSLSPQLYLPHRNILFPHGRT